MAEQPKSEVLPAIPLEREAEFVPFAQKEAIKLSVSIVTRLLCTPTRSGKTCPEKDAIRFIMLCKARALNPFEGDAYLIGFDSQDGPSFQLITAHQAFLKRAEAHPAFDGMDSGVYVRDAHGNLIDREGDFTFDDDVILGAWAVVYRKDRSHHTKRRLKLTTYNKGRSRWKDDPAGMIVKCVEADALRSSFPTTLAGMYLEEEFAPKEVEPAKPLPTGRRNFRNTPAPEINGHGDETIPPAGESETPASSEPHNSPVPSSASVGSPAVQPAGDKASAPSPGGSSKKPKGKLGYCLAAIERLELDASAVYDICQEYGHDKIEDLGPATLAVVSARLEKMIADLTPVQEREPGEEA